MPCLHLVRPNTVPMPQSVKFDDLCTNFKHHESLDESMPYVTMSLNEDGSMAGMEYVKGSGSAGLVPLTVPTASAASVRFCAYYIM